MQNAANSGSRPIHWEEGAGDLLRADGLDQESDSCDDGLNMYYVLCE